MKAVILKELPDHGQRVIEKFEKEATTCCFAISLMTPDDHVSVEHGERAWQPRQNVMFELGWFCARLGRQKVLFIKKKGTSLPSDFASVIQKEFDNFVIEDLLVASLELELKSHGII